MAVRDTGHGPPLVLVPSLQGRWEYLSAAVEALARSHRVITFSLPDAHGDLNTLAGEVGRALDQCGVSSASICGVSFGGRVALRFAALHPQRTDALVLVSVPGPGWQLRPSHRWIARHPRTLAPLFFAGMPARLWAELRAAMPGWRERRAFARQQWRTFLRAPLSPSQMAARALLIDGMETAADCAAISAPTLVITGERHLDHVVPADGSSGFAPLIANAQAATLERTGHLGCITRPEAFAHLVTTFLQGPSAT